MVNLRQFRSDVDMAIFGRDQDGSNAYENQSRRAPERFCDPRGWLDAKSGAGLASSLMNASTTVAMLPLTR